MLKNSLSRHSRALFANTIALALGMVLLIQAITFAVTTSQKG